MALWVDEFVIGASFLLPAYAHDDGIDQVNDVHHRNGEVAGLDVHEDTDAVDGDPKPPLLTEHPDHQYHGHDLHHGFG